MSRLRSTNYLLNQKSNALAFEVFLYFSRQKVNLFNSQSHGNRLKVEISGICKNLRKYHLCNEIYDVLINTGVSPVRKTSHFNKTDHHQEEE